MTKGMEYIDKFMEMGAKLHHGINLTPSQYQENYKAQEKFFESIYEDGWKAGMEDAIRVNQTLEIKKQ